MKRLLLINLVLSLVLVLGTGAGKLFAQSWEPTNGPYGGNISCFTENSSYLFAGSPGGVFGKGIFRSADHGANWTSANNGLGQGAQGKDINALGVSGSNVVATTGQGIYYSTNNGDSWTISGFTGQYYPMVYLSAGSNLFAGGTSGLYLSTDNGISWLAQNDNFQGITPPAVPEIRSLTANGTTLYAGTYRKGIFRSTDNGLTWVTVNDGLGTTTQLNSRTFGNFAVSGTTVFASTYGQGIYRLLDNGTTWTQEITGLPTGSARNVISIFINDSFIYISTGAGIYRSANSDVISWSLQTTTPSGLTISKLFPSGTDIFATTNQGVHISADNTATWTSAYNGMLGLMVDQISTAGGNEIIASMNTGNFFRSSDFGETWEMGNMTGSPFFFNNYLFLYNDNGWIYRSSDNGATWQQLYEIGTLTRFSSMGSTLFARITCCEMVFYSTDNGTTWTPATGVSSQIFSMADDGSTLYAGTQMQGVVKSADNGVTWTETTLPTAIPVRSLVTNGTYVFAGTSNFYDDPQINPVGIYRSGDNGSTWQLVNTGLTNLDICSMVFNGTDLYAGTKGGVFKSTNNGDSWTQINNGFTTPPVAFSLHIAGNYLFTNNWVTSLGQPVYRMQLSGSAPEQPSAITGDAYPCIGTSQSYSVDNVSGVTYTWQVPSDWVIESGNSTNAITVTVGSSDGIILVIPSNVWGNGPSQFLVVNPVLSVPAQPDTITGPINPVTNNVVEYSVTSEAGVTFNWTFPEGWSQQSGNNSNIVTVLVGENSGVISVTPESSCGTGEPELLSVDPVSSEFPTVYTVTGGGPYCEGNAGLPVGLSGSQEENVYTLYKDGVIQSSIPGDGNPLSFGNQIQGTYTIMADNGLNTIWMSGSAVLTESSAIPVSVVISLNQQEVCEGSSVTITAIAENGGTNPAYAWYLNGEATGGNSPEYNYTPVDSDQVYVVLTSDLGGCVVNNPSTSNTISIQTTENLPVSVSIVPDTNDVCAGTPVTFTASPVNGGSPNYQWYVNGEQTGTDQTSFSYIPEDEDEVYAVMTSSLTCTSNNPATSNVVTMVINALPEVEVQISANNNNVCAGTLVTFTATPVNGGENPEYAWQVNGVQQGIDEPTFTYTPENGDQVNVVMTSDLPCTQENPAISNTIFMTVNDILPVSVVITADDDAVCVGTPVTLTATPQNGGTATYQWYVNASPTGANQASLTYTPENGDTVYVELTSSLSCVSGNPATSNIVEITVDQEVTPSVTISASTNPVLSGEPVTFTATPVNGGTDPEYLWFLNGFTVGAGVSYTCIPVDGDEVYVLMISSLECLTNMSAVSNTIVVEVITGTLVMKSDSVRVTSYDNNVVITRRGGLKGHVEVIDLTGRLIQERTMTGEDRMEIAIESGTGIYLVRVNSSEGPVNEKVFIR